MKNTIKSAILIATMSLMTCFILGSTDVYANLGPSPSPTQSIVTTANKDYSYLLTYYGLDVRTYVKDMSLQEQLATVNEIQATAHKNAEEARSLEICNETISVIDKNKEIWYNTNIIKEEILIAINEYNYNLELMARVIWYEAGSNWLKDEHQQLVGMVVLNRVALNNSSIKDVISQRGQYSCAKQVLNGGTPKGITQRCYTNAELVLQGKVSCPSDVIFQSESKQGKVYKKFYNSYSGTYTYFCYK